MRRHALPMLLLLLAPTAVAQDVRLPDLSMGQIDGKRAMMVWPMTAAQPQTPLPADGCEAHLVPVGDLERELRFPCGKWFLPPAATYRVWAEKPGFTTASYAVVKYDGEPFTGRGMAVMLPIEPAGRVVLAERVALPPAASFRLLQIRGVKNGVLLGAFDRRIAADAARAGVQMGAGTVLAGIFDRQTNDAIALSRPIAVAAGQTAAAAPEPPAKGTDVFATLERPRVVKAGEEEVALVLEAGGAARRPDVFMNTPNRVFAVWYGVEGKSARLRMEGATYTSEIALRPRTVVTVRGKF